jgi:hypothetical protein
MAREPEYPIDGWRMHNDVSMMGQDPRGGHVNPGVPVVRPLLAG